MKKPTYTISLNPALFPFSNMVVEAGEAEGIDVDLLNTIGKPGIKFGWESFTSETDHRFILIKPHTVLIPTHCFHHLLCTVGDRVCMTDLIARCIRESARGHRVCDTHRWQVLVFPL